MLVQVQPADRAFQRNFCRPVQLDSPLVECELEPITNELTPSAFLAKLMPQQVVPVEGVKFPLASLAVKSSPYSDNTVCGAPDLTPDPAKVFDPGRRWSSEMQQPVINLVTLPLA
jgi:hypothetical protein